MVDLTISVAHPLSATLIPHKRTMDMKRRGAILAITFATVAGRQYKQKQRTIVRC